MTEQPTPGDSPNTKLVAALPPVMRALDAAGITPQVTLAYWGEYATIVAQPTPTADQAADALTAAGATQIRVKYEFGEHGPDNRAAGTFPGDIEIRVVIKPVTPTA